MDNATAPAPLIGHGAKWDALRRAFARDLAPQTLLLSGPARIGKWTFALRYAQLLLCPHAGENLIGGLPAPCGRCRVCHQVEIETYPDFRVCRPIISKTNPERAPEALDSSAILIEAAREFSAEALYASTAGPFKIMAMAQADRMTVESQNTLLKTFEEPNPTVKIVLISDKPHRLLPTVRSRCWELKLATAPRAEIEGWLHGAFAELPREAINSALLVGEGLPGAAWREAQRWREAQESGATPASRFDAVQEIIGRIQKGSPVAALALSEEALALAEKWGEEDHINRVLDDDQSGLDKKLARTLMRAQVTRFLDELARGYRSRWHDAARQHAAVIGARGKSSRMAEHAEAWASGLDHIRKTRHYILRNANTHLALTVLFGQLCAAHRAAPGSRATQPSPSLVRPPARPPARPSPTPPPGFSR
jgi:hypothetical protein